MKKVLFLAVAFLALLSINPATAQISKGNPNFAKGQIDVNAGFGLMRTFYSGLSTSIPPISVSAEYGITDEISVGGFLGYASAKDRIFLDDNDYAKYSFVIIGARGSYHLTIWDKMDTYAGLMLGYNVASAKINSDLDYLDNYSVAASGFALSAYIGGRYNFNEKLGAYAELGYGIAVLNLGVTFKL